jgi:hypothetical protein
VPDDIAVVGFDDAAESRYMTPPLTTVRQPLHELGSAAVDMLLRILKGERVAPQTMLRARLEVRQSCGCFGFGAKSEKTPIALSPTISGERHLDCRKIVQRFREMRVTDSRAFFLPPEDVQKLASSLCNDINAGKSIAFVKIVDRLARRYMHVADGLRLFHESLLKLHRAIFEILDRSEASFAHELFQEAMAAAGELAQRREGYRRLLEKRRETRVRDIGNQFANTLDVAALMELIARNAPRLGIRSCYLVLHGADRVFSRYSRLALACRDGMRADRGFASCLFETANCIPAGIMTNAEACAFIIEPLYFREESFGYILFEANAEDEELYETLGASISGALHSGLLVRKVRRQAEELQKANQELARLRDKERAYLDAIKAELNLGRQIQMGFLPESLPQPGGWELHAAFMPAREACQPE